MQRAITGFHLDPEQHWVAELSCGHDQHTRHDPPMVERAWVLTEDGRASRIGAPLDCRRCDRAELPDGVQPYKRTPTFTATSIPSGLRSNHATKPGVWGLIHVEQGRLEYTIERPPQRSQELGPGTPGVVVPEVEHRVAPRGDVSFYVEFLRRR